MSARVAVLASGRGSNLQALIDYIAALGRRASSEIVLVASNRSDAHALTRARDASIPSESFTASDDGSALLELLQKHKVELVVLAGYLKKIPPRVVSAYRGRIVNVHPGLLPEFGGAGMYGARVHEAVLASGAKYSGVSVHLVDDEFDRGPLVAQWRVPVLEGDTQDSLAARVLEVEHLVFPRAVEMIAALKERNFVADF
jgi:formyltetrahydrofolate-dependent phosphoribosylglycinamide formyltransferase